MVLYTLANCPLCSVAKIKLAAAGIEFTECHDEAKMDELGIERLPMGQLGDTLLDFTALKALWEGQQ